MPVTVSQTIADPHVTNFKGKEFFFYGNHDECFCLISSSNFYLNVRLYDTQSKAPIMTEAAIVVGNSQVGVKKYFVSSLNAGMEYIVVKNHTTDIVNLPCDSIEVFDTGLMDRKSEPIFGSLKVFHDHIVCHTGNFITKIVRCTNKEHNALGPAHLDIYNSVDEIGILTEGVWPHGLVGCSLHPDCQNDFFGKESDYKISDLFETDFEFNVFEKYDLDKKQWFVGADKKAISM